MVREMLSKEDNRNPSETLEDGVRKYISNPHFICTFGRKLGDKHLVSTIEIPSNPLDKNKNEKVFDTVRKFHASKKKVMTFAITSGIGEKSDLVKAVQYLNFQVMFAANRYGIALYDEETVSDLTSEKQIQHTNRSIGFYLADNEVEGLIPQAMSNIYDPRHPRYMDASIVSYTRTTDILNVSKSIVKEEIRLELIKKYIDIRINDSKISSTAIFNIILILNKEENGDLRSQQLQNIVGVFNDQSFDLLALRFAQKTGAELIEDLRVKGQACMVSDLITPIDANQRASTDFRGGA